MPASLLMPMDRLTRSAPCADHRWHRVQRDFFSDAVCDEDLVVGGVGNRWSVAWARLHSSRRIYLGQQVSFRQEFEELLTLAKTNSKWTTPCRRTHGSAYSSRDPSPQLDADRPGSRRRAGRGLDWQVVLGGWHRRMGELAMLVAGRKRCRRSMPTKDPETARAIKSEGSSGRSSTPSPPSMADPTRCSETSSVSGCLGCQRPRPDLTISRQLT